MRLGIFGGTFDPPHVGHLLAATDALEQLRLDLVLMVPAATQPLKAGQGAAPPEQRLAMVRLMVRGDPRFDVSDVEVLRAGLSFTVDTLRHIAASHPSAERYLLLGADALSLFGQWREPERIVELARLAILERAGEPLHPLPPGIDPGRIERLATRRVDISSTEIRERVRLGRSIRGFVTDAVADVIARDGLYR